jgi:hypothetical protein
VKQRCHEPVLFFQGAPVRTVLLDRPCGSIGFVLKTMPILTERFETTDLKATKAFIAERRAPAYDAVTSC